METVGMQDEKNPIQSRTKSLKTMLDSIGFADHSDMYNSFSSTLKAGKGSIYIVVHRKYEYVDAVFVNGIATKDLLFQQSFENAKALKDLLESNRIISQFLKKFT